MPRREGKTKGRRKHRSSKAKTSVSQVKRICQNVLDKNTEFKRILRALPATAVTNITDGQLIWQGPRIPQGDGENDRNGLEVNLRTLRFNLLFKSIGASNRVRIILVKYPQTIGVAGNLNDCLVNVSAQNVMISPWLKSGPVKYQILHNKIYNLGTKTVMDGTYKYQSFKFDIKFKKSGQKVHYDDATTTNPDKNSFYMYCVADQALASPNQNEVLCYSTSVFTDC